MSPSSSSPSHPIAEDTDQPPPSEEIPNPPLSSLTSEPLHDYRPPEAEVVPNSPRQLVYPADAGGNESWWTNQASDWNTTPPQEPSDWQAPPTVVEPNQTWYEPPPDVPSDPPYDWWNGEHKKLTPQRPGPGMLPSGLEEKVLEDTVFTVEIASIPEGQPMDGFVPPTPEELKNSVSHHSLHYSKKHNGWVFLLVRKGCDLPATVNRDITDATSVKPLPHQRYRELRQSCLDTIAVSTWDSSAKPLTHHFHLYEKAVDSTALGLTYEELVTIPTASPSSPPSSSSGSNSQMETDNTPTPLLESIQKPHFLDLYVCRHCSTHVLTSHALMPGIIPSNLLTPYVEERGRNPQPGKTPEASMALGVEAIVT